MIFDAHSDLLEDFTIRRLWGETDIFNRLHRERYQRGNIEGSIFAIFVDPPYNTDRDVRYRTEQIMKAAKQELDECDSLAVVHNFEELMQAKREGKFYVILGVEGMAAIKEDITWIDCYYDFGVRHAMLTWNEENTLAAGATSGNSQGLTALGKKVIRRLQDKGMIVDVSHLNDRGFWDIAEMASAPFIASHSNARALCDVPRNLNDDQLRAVRDCGGVVGLNAYRDFVDPDPDYQTVERLAEHAAHMIDVMGIDHVGCGFDFFEFLEKEPGVRKENQNVKGLTDCSEAPNLFACFDRMGMSREEKEKIAFRNFYRIIQQILG